MMIYNNSNIIVYLNKIKALKLKTIKKETLLFD